MAFTGTHRFGHRHTSPSCTHRILEWSSKHSKKWEKLRNFVILIRNTEPIARKTEQNGGLANTIRNSCTNLHGNSHENTQVWTDFKKKKTHNEHILFDFIFIFTQISAHFQFLLLMTLLCTEVSGGLADGNASFFNLNMIWCAMISPIWRNTSCHTWRFSTSEPILWLLDGLSVQSIGQLGTHILLYEKFVRF